MVLESADLGMALVATVFCEIFINFAIHENLLALPMGFVLYEVSVDAPRWWVPAIVYALVISYELCKWIMRKKAIAQKIDRRDRHRSP